jgi:hypothetical protein
MSQTLPVALALEPLQTQFLALLPRIKLHANFSFRHIRCPETRQENIAETIGLCWKWFRRLRECGKDPSRFPSALAAYATRAVRCGRRVCGMERAKDVLSPRAQLRYGFTVERLPHSLATPHEDLYGEANGQRQQDEYEERLRDNTRTPPPEQAAFRIDWPKFLQTLTARDRKLAWFLSLGHSAKAAAAKFNLSPGRVTQLRQQWCREWRCRQGEA